MDEREALLTDLVTAMAASVAAAFHELELRAKGGNFSNRVAAQAIRDLITKVPEGATNRELVISVYANFAAAFAGKLSEAPPVSPRRRASSTNQSSRSGPGTNTR